MSTDWPAGIARVILDETESTNAEALKAEGPAWIMARRQTAARGRRGRPWATPEGNFAGSLAFWPDMPPDRAALYSFVASLALHDVLCGLTDRRLGLKWPNDVLLDGGKLAGILLESSANSGGANRLVIGIGVNLAFVPEGVVEGSAPPVALDADIGPEAFLDRLAPAFAARDAEFRAGGFAPIRVAWLARAARIGEHIVARTQNDSHGGVFQDVDASGALILATGGGTRTVTAADVFF